MTLCQNEAEVKFQMDIDHQISFMGIHFMVPWCANFPVNSTSGLSIVLNNISYYTRICVIRDLSGETDSYHPSNARVIRVGRAR